MDTRKHLLENCGRYGLAKKWKSKAKTKSKVKAIVIDEAHPIVSRVTSIWHLFFFPVTSVYNLYGSENFRSFRYFRGLDIFVALATGDMVLNWGDRQLSKRRQATEEIIGKRAQLATAIKCIQFRDRDICCSDSDGWLISGKVFFFWSNSKTKITEAGSN